MKYSQARQGRVFVIRLEHGEVLHEVIERFALEKKIEAAALILVGASDRNSRLVVGPEDGDARPIIPMEHVLDEAHEIAGAGTLFRDEEDNPILHMHAANGRLASTVTGCVRSGVRIWHVGEVILFELLGTPARRRFEPETGFKLLNPEG
jgi:predicted DNA-binding protein with PD1-like motif